MPHIEFSGRFRTDNGLVVAIHKLDKRQWATGDRNFEVIKDALYWGHEVRTTPPYEDDTIYFWDQGGHCVALDKEGLGITRDSLMEFDLVHRLSQSEEGYATEVVDCKDCHVYQGSMR